MPTKWILLLFACETLAMAELTKCEKVAAVAAWRDHNTVVETNLKTLAGTWISEGCETRPGPEYVLRSYTFQPDGGYYLIQHHYWDDSCSSPKLTVVAFGRIQLRNSLEQAGASNGFAKPINVTVIPQDSAAASELDRIVTKECPGQFWKSWKRNEEHLVFDNQQARRGTFNLWANSYQPINNHHPITKSIPQNSGDLACLGSLKWAFNELKLIKVQYRPVLHTKKQTKQVVQMELLLGDIHSSRKQREFYSPTSFQTLLVKQTKGENVTVKRHQFLVKNANSIPIHQISSRVPPHLIQKLHLPVIMGGDWTSTRCEIRPLDVYLLRHFTFDEENLRWVGEHKFFSDPFCSFAKFIVTATGHFTLMGPNNAMTGVENIDFKIERATLTALDTGVITAMGLEGYCGIGPWKVHTPKELGLTGGCINLGIVIPSIQYDIIKVEMDFEGSWLLFLGQPDTNNKPTTYENRPTAFQFPLVKCGEKSWSNKNLIERLERRHYFDSQAHRTNSSKFAVLVLVFTTFLTYR